METVTAAEDGRNIGTSILMRYTDPNNQVDLEIRRLIVVMSQLFRDHKTASTPEAYLGSTCSSLDLLINDSDSNTKPRPTDVIDAHLTILSVVIPEASARFLMRNLELIFSCLRRPLRSKSPLPATTCCVGVQCLANLITAITKGFNTTWSDVSKIYGFLLSFATMSGAYEVPKEACSCLRRLLECFKGTSLLDPASKKITDLLNKYPPPQLDICKEEDALLQRQAYKAGMAFDAVAEVLPVISIQDRTAVLYYFKSLFQRQQEHVTLGIIRGLHTLCLHPSLDVSPELLLDLICCICHSVSKHEIYYTGEYISKLLGSGVAQVYSLNRQICETKLPIVFDALKVIMVKPIIEGIVEEIDEDSEENMAHAAQAFRFLINSCIDESMIKQEVDRVLMNASMFNRANSEPTVIEKLCGTIQSLFGYRGDIIMVLALEIVSTMFDKLGVYSSCLMKGTLKMLADIQKLPDQEFPFKKGVMLILQMVVEKWGIDAIMSVMPQEHMELLAEINEPLGSKYVEARSNDSIATTVSNYLKLEMDDPDIEYEAMNREFDKWHAKQLAEGTILQRMSDASVMTKKLRI